MKLSAGLAAIAVASVFTACGDGSGGDAIATQAQSSSTASTTIATSLPPAGPPTSASPSTTVSSPASTPAPTTTSTAVPAPEVVDPLPNVAMHRVGTGTEVDLASLLPADRPVLLWMWAPH